MQNDSNPGMALPAALMDAISADDPVSGHTHSFYRYPARFSPLFVREVVRQFSEPGDVVLDPFMGGGTTIVEALASGRRAVGIDLNTLSHFVATVKTSPLSINDVELIGEWLEDVLASSRPGIAGPSEPIPNLPWHLKKVWADLIEQAGWLPLERQRQFVRCGLLKMGQWAIDSNEVMPSGRRTLERFGVFVREMLQGLTEFVESCESNGIQKNQIRKSRILLCRSTAQLETDSRLNGLPRPRLVVTSPPYPAIHILYHRWQVQGRRETAAPYWLAAQKDGHSASHYTFGSRSSLGIENYFLNLRETFSSVRKIVASDALVVQLVAFSDVASQLPRYLESMDAAGFKESRVFQDSNDRRLWRNVPNRKWYCRTSRNGESSKELLLIHQPT